MRLSELPRHCTRRVGHAAFLTALFVLVSMSPSAVAHAASPSSTAPQKVLTAADIARSTPHLGAWPKTSVPEAVRPGPDLAHWVPAPNHQQNGSTNTAASTNWSGIIDQGSSFTGIGARWVVPSVTPTSDLEVSSNWIGIDGATNTSLIQTGTTEETEGGESGYFAWWEILPADSVETFLVSPGDQISASVTKDSPGSWTITITDVTQGVTFSQVFSYSGPASSAEWIEEAPSDGSGDQVTLANYGNVQFTNEEVSSTALDSLAVTPVVMLNLFGTAVISYPGAFTANGFTATYGAQSIGTTTKAIIPSDPVTVGSSVTYSATVTPGTTSGTVSFIVGTTLLCTIGALVSGTGSCSSTAAPIGDDVVTALYSGSSTTYAASSGTSSVAILNDPGNYVAMTPVRICDTRSGNPSRLSGAASQCDGTSNAGDSLAAGANLTMNVAGDFGVPSTAVTAVMLNVTEVNATAPGYFTLYPAGSSRPTASSLNYVAGQVVPNLVEVGVGTGGQVTLFSAAHADAIIDLEGYVTTTALGGAGLYNALSSPARICDTRGGNPSHLVGLANQCDTDTTSGRPDHLIGPTNPMTIDVTGIGNVPASGVAAVVLNVTVTSATGPGYITVFPQGAARPTASNVNFGAGQVIANRVTVAVGTGTGQITLFSAAPTDLIVDVSGYFTSAGGTGAQFTPEPAPARICDTRGGNPSRLTGGDDQCNTDVIAGSPDNPLGSNSARTIQASGLGNVPSGAVATVMNLTAVSPTQSGYLTVYPQGQRPTTSDLNPPTGGVLANLVVATLAGGGTFNVYNAVGTTNVIFDVAGWYTT